MTSKKSYLLLASCSSVSLGVSAGSFWAGAEVLDCTAHRRASCSRSLSWERGVVRAVECQRRGSCSVGIWSPLAYSSLRLRTPWASCCSVPRSPALYEASRELSRAEGSSIFGAGTTAFEPHEVLSIRSLSLPTRYIMVIMINDCPCLLFKIANGIIL